MKEKGLLILSSTKYKDSNTLFDVEKYENTIKLKFSKLQETWTLPGTVSSMIEDTGDGFIVTFKNLNGKRKEIFLDYSSAEELRALLKLMDDQGGTFEYLKRKPK